ncbi:MAG: hypothetical protein EOP84_17285, partial [Verrucomicrobiaceae bacterium]
MHGFSLSDNGTTHPEQAYNADPDHDGYSNLEESEYGTNPTERGGVPGMLLLDTWNALPGDKISDLVWHKKFSRQPDRTEFIYSAQAPINRFEEFGSRMRGYVIPAVSGDYEFYISGDDSCELWLSPNSNQFAKSKVAFQVEWADVIEWSKYPSQKSVAISLIAGRKYYIEALMKEGILGDHLKIGWKAPGSETVSVIEGNYLESYAYDERDPDGDNMPTAWEVARGLNPDSADAESDPDYDGIPNVLEYDTQSNPLAKNRFQGALLREVWRGVPSYTIHSDIARERRLSLPDEHELALNTQGPTNYGEAYLDRYRGYITAPVSGSYQFWAVGDEMVEVWLSSTQSKFKKELLIHPTSQIRNYDADLSMKSRLVELEAGKKYYFEVIHVNHHGGDFCEVAWKVPGGQREIIPSNVLSTFIPIANDKDDDDLPDDWELSHGLDPLDNGRVNPVNGYNGDLDGDGLSNGRERSLRTNPSSADSDGDGVADYDETEVLETNPRVADNLILQPLATISGADYTSSHGQWIARAGKAVQGSVRGWVGYPLTVPAGGVYYLDLSFTPFEGIELSRDYDIVYSIDGVEVERLKAYVPEGSVGRAKVMTPWLKPGPHDIRVTIDNSYNSRRVNIDTLVVSSVGGPDGNGNGIPENMREKI